MGYRGKFDSGAGSGSVPVTSEFKRNRVANKVIALTVSRGAGQKKHVFKTKPAREVEAILLACRKEFLTLEEEEQEVVLSLYHGVSLCMRVCIQVLILLLVFHQETLVKSRDPVLRAN